MIMINTKEWIMEDIYLSFLKSAIDIAVTITVACTSSSYRLMVCILDNTNHAIK